MTSDEGSSSIIPSTGIDSPLQQTFNTFIHLHIPLHNQPHIMRFSSILLLALPALAIAAPSNKRENDGKKEMKEMKDKHDDHKDGKDLIKGVFGFTSTYVAYAGPDQV